MAVLVGTRDHLGRETPTKGTAVKKSARNRKQKEEKSASGQRRLHLASIIERHLYEFVLTEGMKALDEVLEQDRELMCGPAHAKRQPHQAQRWGRTDGRLVMGGRRVIVSRPRVRKDGEEVVLPSWVQFADEDPLNERTLDQLVVGVPTRSYERSLEELPEELEPHGASRSAASRRFVATAQRRLEEWQRRDLGELGIIVVMLDGIEIGEHTVIVALGIDESGKKHPLGLWLGATENAKVCGALLDDLIRRGLDPQRAYLFVIDGGKALRKTIRERFGRRALVQRCQEHKRRNVLGHLPKRVHPSVSKTMRNAYESKSAATAKQRLRQLIAELESEHPDAAASLREGLDETLTLKDMGLLPWLERTLSTTNPIKNLNSGIRRVIARVKRWRDGKMVKRWAAAGILEAERGFRRLRGYKGIPVLVAALSAHAEQIDRVDAEEAAA